MRKNTVEMFWAFAKKSDTSDCWEWTGTLWDGYGEISFNGRKFKAHRLAWELANKAPIPDGLSVCHKCDNPKCINPEHLFLGTYQDNAQDRHRKGRSAVGQRVNTAKLTEADVLKIRSSTESGSCLARKYYVNKSTIYRIKSRESWRYLR